MTVYRLKPRAARDISEIWDYTLKQWGLRQTEIYLAQIRTCFELVAGEPDIGRKCDDIRLGYRKILVGSHVIFYRLQGSNVEIIRVLHQKMDLERYL